MANGQVQQVQITPDKANATDEINVVDYAGQLVTDPALMINKTAGTSLGALDPNMTPAQVTAGQQANAPAMDYDKLNQTAAQGATATGAMPTQDAAAQVDPELIGDKVNDVGMTGANSTVSQNAQINPADLEIDTEATGAGTNATGAALNDYAKQDISKIIDTSTPAGKALATQLGDGNYTDSKATVKGQLDILQNEFIDPTTGEPKIPSWAAGTARAVSRIAAFKGMTGSAATAAMSQALLEASLPIATEDAKFFQTITLKNLDHRQESIINKANVLSKLDVANLDARTTAAVTNAKAFLEMDMANLANEQQAEVINTQERFQALMEDNKTENTARLFNAESTNDMNKFYDGLSANMSQFNAAQKNQMTQFNTSESNDMKQFNATMEDSREKFYRDQQYNIDASNAKWRQTVTLTENAQAFEAAATDVRNRIGIGVEELNRLWDRSDALLDYSWKAGQNDKDRKTQLALVSLKGEIDSKTADQEGWGKMIGTLLGGLVGWIF